MTFLHASTTDPVSLPEPFTLTSFVCLLCPSFFLPLFFFPQALNEWDVVSLPEPFTLTVHEGRVAPSGRQQQALQMPLPLPLTLPQNWERLLQATLLE